MGLMFVIEGRMLSIDFVEHFIGKFYSLQRALGLLLFLRLNWHFFHDVGDAAME